MAHLGFGLDDALQFGDVLVKKFLLLFGAKELLATHFDFEVVVVRHFYEFVLESLNLR